MELAAVGVSIALFNQVSRIAIFPLVSITTSFVAEEDTIGSVSPEAEDSDNLEGGSTLRAENKLLIPRNQNGLLLSSNIHSSCKFNQVQTIASPFALPFLYLYNDVDQLHTLVFCHSLYQMTVRIHTTQNQLVKALV